MLPSPTNSRFQPLRSGLINLFKYQEQEFWYERGRLLIRGNNGTGKSRVLALQLPFLLDGEISPRRVEPDGDPARQIAWHLLMDEHNERTGYTWIEFGRRDDAGAESFVTLGCGMRAIRGGDNQPTRWFFITEKRVGDEFKLVDNAQPLNADRLGEVLGNECLYKTARDYRLEIDRRLFGLGKERYEALIELLIRLRAPQLSKKLEERTIFAALSDALPPLSADVVENVAKSFKQLDELREQHASLLSLSQSLAGFQSGYQTYLQLALLRRAEKVRSCHAKYEEAQRQTTEIERTIEAGRDRQREATALIAQRSDIYTAAETRFDVLQQSSLAGDAQRLDDLQRAADTAAKNNDSARSRADDAATKLQLAEGEIAKHTPLHDKSNTTRDAAWREASKLAQPAGFGSEHSRLLPNSDIWQPDPALVSKLRTSHQKLADDHLHRLDQIDVGLAIVADSQRKLASAQATEDRIAGQVALHLEAAQGHDQAARCAVSALAVAYAEWQQSLQRLEAPPWSELAPSFIDWLEADDDRHRMLSMTVENAHRLEINAIAIARAELKVQRDALARERHEFVNERESLSHAPPPPPTPATRDQAARANRAGAPLWQLCEFHPNLSHAERIGLEAALEASGLLDAWIAPDGNLSGDLPNDTFLAVGNSTDYGQTTLADWLVLDPQTSSVIAPEVLHRVLARIGAGPSVTGHWVALDGCWQLGPVFGRGRKSQAQHLGAASRDVARQQRLDAIDTELRLLDARALELDQKDNGLHAREEAATTERGRAPGDSEVVRHLTLRTEARRQRDATSAEHSAAVQATHRSRTENQSAVERLRRDAQHLGYGAHLDELPKLRPAWQPYALAMGELWAAAQAWSTSSRELERLEGARRTQAEAQAIEAEQAQAAQTESVRADATFKTLQQRLGSSISDFQNDLRVAREARTQAQNALDAARDQISKIQAQLAAVEGSLTPALAKVTESGDVRDKAIQALRVPLLCGLYPEAQASLADIENDAWSPTRAYAIARRIDKELPEANLSEEAWTRRLNELEGRIHDLRTNTGAACEIESEVLSEGLTMVVCRYQGLKLKPAECLAAVGNERDTHERLLDAGERDIIDRHLITEVSLHLQNLIENSLQRTNQMNKEMSRCATTLGVALRLGWEPLTEGLPSGLPAVRKLLLVDHASWSPDERTTVGRFLHQLIQNERIENPQATAAEQLLRALDYRQWHMFYAERHQNGRWERLTKKRYGTGSGGEKALMLTIPQMAAASSHYQSAAAHAPRFILLDEAFAGMDPPTRARLMGLLEAFDLDLLMTSEREWGTHATVPGIAIYQLVADADAVAATRWVWNGRAKLLAPVPDTPDFRLTP